MSKVGRNRKGLRWGAPNNRKTPWKPIQATHEERFQIIKKPDGTVDYKSIILPKR